MNEENAVTFAQEEHPQQVLPTQVDVRIYAIHTSGPVLAEASANLNGCFTIRGLKVVDVGNGPFISMPGSRVGGRYRDACFPSEREFRQQFRQAVLDAYEQALYQLPRRQQEAQTEPAEDQEKM